MTVGDRAENPVRLDPWQNIIKFEGGGPARLIVFTVRAENNRTVPAFARVFSQPTWIGWSTVAHPIGEPFVDRRAEPMDTGEHFPFKYLAPPPAEPSSWTPSTETPTNKYITVDGAIFVSQNQGTTSPTQPAFSTQPETTTQDNDISWLCKKFQGDWISWFVGVEGAALDNAADRNFIVDTSQFLSSEEVSFVIALDPLFATSDAVVPLVHVAAYKGRDGVIGVNGNNVTYTGPKIKNFFKAGDITKAKFTPSLLMVMTLTLRLRRRAGEQPLSVAGGTLVE